MDALPVLTRDELCLREVHATDAAALVALFARPDVSAHLDPPPATVDEFLTWIALSQSRRADNRAACFTLLAGNQEVSGLFMALRLDGFENVRVLYGGFNQWKASGGLQANARAAKRG